MIALNKRPLSGTQIARRSVWVWWLAAAPHTRYMLSMSDGFDQTDSSAAGERNHMDEHPQNAWNTVQYDARFDEYWIKAGDARQSLFYCPWCGEKLPPTQRDRWFDEVEALGLDPWNDEVPDRFRSAAWRRAIRPIG